ncbi:hypothetical protein B0H13DRAFT_1937377 [Mycena leptocephala]|nr:hypothetical protein B0H13DRAFT_1937377 [Mycena leptocephala]
MFSIPKLVSLCLPSRIFSFVPVLAFAVYSTLSPIHHVKSQLSAGFTPSRVSGTPTKVIHIAVQDKPCILTTGALIICCIILCVLAGTWDGVNANNDDDGAADGNDGGGDVDPQQEAGVDGEDARPEDENATAAAPAPEDPPPPPGEMEEGDDDDDLAAPEGGLSWFSVLLVGTLVLQFLPRRWRQTPATGNVKAAYGVVPSFNIGLDASAPTLIEGFLQRRSPPNPLGSQLTQVTLGLDPEVPTVVQQQALAAYSVAPVARQIPRPLCWKTFFLLAALPALGFVGTILRLLLPFGTNAGDMAINLVANLQELPLPPVLEHVGEPEPPLPTIPHLIPLSPSPPATPRRAQLPVSPPTTPHLRPIAPSSISPPHQRPLPYRDAATQATCDRMVNLLHHTTALRTARCEIITKGSEENAVRERKDRVRKVQARIWKELYELRLGAEDLEDEERVVV